MKNHLSQTFSIVAVDPTTGVCGAAVASKFPAVGKVVPYVRADVGAFCTQHQHNPIWGAKALDLLGCGLLPEEVLASLLRDDPNSAKRQLALIDMKGQTATRNPIGASPSGIWWGSMSGKFYTCQGNTLVGPSVIIAMANAYESSGGLLAGRLMAALVAGDQAGGDHRGRLAAALRVASAGVEDIALDIDESNDAVMELNQKYARYFS
ncbi:hypothetical protein CMK19_03070 [Candidatus Poribacteria bacterium]|jgi:uncharacterized Ntn-hydrolase superfamily protein|nr:hypothetical protein [Candidatus Poribacteria bacterium]|tara:strand:- start:109 stop:732 length:624 start_codon:yes stop_codon:yes gene_type:complete